MIVPIHGVADVGLVLDRPSYLIEPNAWSGGKNIRFQDGSVQRVQGYSSVITPSVAPYAIFSAPVVGSLYWIYAGLAKVYGFIGASSADITRASGGDYTATVTDQWQGGTFNGIFYCNNGKDDPQYWSPAALTTDLQKLTAWPASTKAKVLRHFKNFLIALDVSKSGVEYPRMIKWSHSADPGTLPSSWDETDDTKDAGEFSLSEGYDLLIDCLQLGDVNMIYTETESWSQRYVGGTYIFNFANVFRGSGILGQGCAVQFLNRHFVLTQDDAIVHDGGSIQSTMDKRIRKWLFSKLSSSAFYTTKVIPNYLDREIWVCFAQGGGSSLNTAVVWNWRDNVWSIRDLPDVRGLACVPQALIGSVGTWDGLGGTWAAPTGLDSEWGDPTRSAYSQSIMMASPDLHIYNVDDSGTFNGSSFESYVEHTGLSVIAIDRYGKVVSDPNQMRMLRAVIPRLSATDGTVVDVFVGAKENPSDSITWQDAKQFVVGTDFKVDCYAVGRFLGIKFRWYGNCKIEGYDLDIAPLGLL